MKKFLTLITFFAMALAFTSCSNSYEATTRKMQRTGFKPYAKKASPGYRGQTESFVGYGKYKAPNRRGVDL